MNSLAQKRRNIKRPTAADVQFKHNQLNMKYIPLSADSQSGAMEVGKVIDVTFVLEGSG